MSTDVTMQELELETAELLPARETLWQVGLGGQPWEQRLQLSARRRRRAATATANGNGDCGLLAGNGNGDGNGSAININSVIVAARTRTSRLLCVPEGAARQVRRAARVRLGGPPATSGCRW